MKDAMEEESTLTRDQRYRMRHPERVKRHQKECYERYRERNIERKRQYYMANKERILQEYKDDKKLCPICQIAYKRLYLPKHMTIRHKLTELPPDLTCKVVND